MIKSVIIHNIYGFFCDLCDFVKVVVCALIVATAFGMTSVADVVDDSSAIKIRIDGSSIIGSYHPIAMRICNLVQKYNQGVNCIVESSGSSVVGLSMLDSGEVDFIILQSDVAFDAVSGTGDFVDSAINDLYYVMRIFPEQLNIIVRKDSGINSFKDLNNKKIALKFQGTSTKRVLLQMLDGYSFGNDTQLIHINTRNAADSLCGKYVDAIVIVTSYPSRAVHKMADKCDIKVIGSTYQEVDRLIANSQNIYLKAHINQYAIDNESYTISTEARLFAKHDVDQVKVEIIRRTIAEHLEEFKSMHPALSQMDLSCVQCTN